MEDRRPYWKVAASLLVSLIGTVVFVVVGFQLMRYFMPFVIGWVIAMIANPVVRWLEKRLKIVEEVIERQLRKYKNKLVARNQEGSNFKQEFFESEDTSSEDDEIKIIRTKRFGIKPMFPEDACIQMDLLGHDFYVFFNAETEEVNVVYKRKNGTFGLIEPEFQ